MQVAQSLYSLGSTSCAASHSAKALFAKDVLPCLLVASYLPLRKGLKGQRGSVCRSRCHYGEEKQHKVQRANASLNEALQRHGHHPIHWRAASGGSCKIRNGIGSDISALHVVSRVGVCS